MYDVIVVGGGISGLSCSKYLSEKGFNVLVLEKANGIGAKMGENLQGFFEYDLKHIDLKVPKDNPMKKFYIWLPKDERLEFNFKKPFMYLVIRGEAEHSFDNYLARQAVNVGAEILTEAKVVDISFTSKGGQVRVDDGRTFNSKYIIAADGANLFVRRILGLDIFETKGIGIGVKMSNVDIEKSTFHGVFGRSIAPGGYGYVNAYPQGGTATVAVSYRPKYASENPTVYFKRFLERIKPIVNHAKEVEKFSGKVVCGEGDQTLVFKNILFVGEAGGFQDRMFGFGMQFAFASAKIASGIIEESYTKNDYSILGNYEGIAKQALIKNINKKSGMSNILKNINDKDIDTVFNAFKGDENLLEKIFQSGDWTLAKWKLLKAIFKRPNLLRFSPEFLKLLIS